MSSCDYIIKGEIIDKKIVAYTGGDFNIVAIKVAITEKYGSNLEDTVWIYPDFEFYYNRQKKLDNIDRDSVYYLTSEDINFNPCFLNYDWYGCFKMNKLCFIRFRKEDDIYIYWLEDFNIPLYVENNNVYVHMNRFQRITNLLRPFDGHNKVGINRFERRIRKWYKRTHKLKQ